MMLPPEILPSAIPGVLTVAKRRFSIMAAEVLSNVDDDQPIRYLDVPVEEPIEIDERLTLGRSLFGDKLAEYLATVRKMKVFSAIVFASSLVIGVLGYVVFYFETFLVNSDTTIYLRWLFACIFPLAMFQIISTSLRLITKLLSRCLLSFDAMYLVGQIVLFAFSWCYIYRMDVELILFWVLCLLANLNTIFSDAMSEKSRQRTGGNFMLYVSVLNTFCVVVWKLSPDSAFHGSVELPGGKWLTNMGYHPIVINPIDFCIERMVTIIIFYGRFLYKQYKYPNAALNLQVPYVRRSA